MQPVAWFNDTARFHCASVNFPTGGLHIGANANCENSVDIFVEAISHV